MYNKTFAQIWTPQNKQKTASRQCPGMLSIAIWHKGLTTSTVPSEQSEGLQMNPKLSRSSYEKTISTRGARTRACRLVAPRYMEIWKTKIDSYHWKSASNQRRDRLTEPQLLYENMHFTIKNLWKTRILLGKHNPTSLLSSKPYWKLCMCTYDQRSGYTSSTRVSACDLSWNGHLKISDIFRQWEIVTFHSCCFIIKMKTLNIIDVG